MFNLFAKPHISPSDYHAAQADVIAGPLMRGGSGGHIALRGRSLRAIVLRVVLNTLAVNDQGHS